MVQLPMMEKVEDMITCFDVMDNRTDGQTPHDGIGHAYAWHHVEKQQSPEVCL